MDLRSDHVRDSLAKRAGDLVESVQDLAEEAHKKTKKIRSGASQAGDHLQHKVGGVGAKVSELATDRAAPLARSTVAGVGRFSPYLAAVLVVMGVWAHRASRRT